MTHNLYTALINVHEDWLDTDNDLHYTTTVLVDAEDIEHVEDKILTFFEKKDIINILLHKVEIIKVFPKIH